MPKNILAITYWSFYEAHIQANVLPSIKIIQNKIPPNSKFFLVTLEKDFLALEHSSALEKKQLLVHENIYWLPFKYYRFGWRAIVQWLWIFVKLIFTIYTNKLSIIHSWCTPAGAAGYILSLLCNKKLIIDSYEPHAESMVENGTWKKNSIAYQVLFWLEKKQTQRASVAIAATQGMKEYALRKYHSIPTHYYVKPACVDLNLFSSDKMRNKALLTDYQFEDKIVCVLAGKFGGIYLDKEVFDFFKVAYDQWKDKFRVLLLSNHSEAEIYTLCKNANLPKHIINLKFVPHADVPNYIGLANFAITPVKPVPSKRYCTPVKNGEYWAMGLPVVIPANISDDSQIINDFHIGAVLESLNTESYKKAVNQIELLLQNDPTENYHKIRKVAERFRGLSIAEDVYSNVYTTV